MTAFSRWRITGGADLLDLLLVGALDGRDDALAQPGLGDVVVGLEPRLGSTSTWNSRAIASRNPARSHSSSTLSRGTYGR